MGVSVKLLNPVVAALLLIVPIFAGSAAIGQSGAPAEAEASTLDTLFSELQSGEDGQWQRAERQIRAEWSKSGSAAMDLLLERGRDALAAGDLDGALDHLTALTDHAPDFAEGWNALATARFQADSYGPAIEDIRRVLALEPRHFGALAGLGRILEDLGETGGALAAFRAAHAIHPHQPDIKAALDRLERKQPGRDI